MADSAKGIILKDNIKTIQSVQRAIDIINCVGAAEQRIRLKEISSKLQLNINTTRGLVQTLLINGFLSKDSEQGTYSLGFEFLNKSKIVYQTRIQHIRDIAYPEMKRISGRFGISSWLQIGFYRDIYTVETVEAPDGYYSYKPKSGSNLPLHASASGKLLLAYMPELERQQIMNDLNMAPLTEFTITDRDTLACAIESIYLQGYASELEEMDIGISGVGAPFFEDDYVLGGTLSVVTSSIKLERILSDVVVELKQACTLITESISSRRWSKMYGCPIIVKKSVESR